MELSFGEQIKIILKRKNMTIRDLAESIEIMTGMKMSRQNLTQRLTRDNFQEKDMRMIASVLGCTLRLSLVEGVPDEITQVVAPRRERELTPREAANHQLTFEDVIKAAGEEKLQEEKAAPKTRTTARILAARAREERIRREAEALNAREERKQVKKEPELDYRQRGQKRLEEEKLAAMEARNESGQLSFDIPHQSAEEMEQVKDIARRALLKTHTEYNRFSKGDPLPEELFAEPQEEEPTDDAPEEVTVEEALQEISDTVSEDTKSEDSNELEVSAESETLPNPEVQAEPEDQAEPEVLAEPESADEDEESPEAASSEEEANAKRAATMDTGDMGVVPEELRKEYEAQKKPEGEMNPLTGEEFESNVVRSHPKLTGYIQVYDREAHKWIDMTEWAFLGFQERKKVLLGSEYKAPIYLD